jgi:hypothetical protein
MNLPFVAGARYMSETKEVLKPLHGGDQHPRSRKDLALQKASHLAAQGRLDI